MPQEQQERNITREEFNQRNKKIRRWQIFLLPLLAACVVPLLGFFWFNGVKPVAEAKDALLPAAGPTTVQVRIAGDMLFGGPVVEQILAQGVEHPFREIRTYLEAADLSMATLETTLSDTGTALPGKTGVLRADPSMIESLMLSGLDVVSLASNHMLDYDTPALEQTITLLESVNIAHIGAGVDESAARKPYVQTQDGLRVAYLAYCENAGVFYSYDYPRSLAAKEDEAGVAALTLETVLEDIANARKTCQVVVLNLHWGEEFSYLPTTSQQEMARRLIDGGADVIVGQHPHSLQSVEVYQNGLIVYSLGNLLYAQTVSRQTREAVILDLTLSELGWQSARLQPVLLTETGQPQLAEGQEALDICERIRSISAGYNATLSFDNTNNTLLISR